MCVGTAGAHLSGHLTRSQMDEGTDDPQRRKGTMDKISLQAKVRELATKAAQTRVAAPPTPCSVAMRSGCDRP